MIQAPEANKSQEALTISPETDATRLQFMWSSDPNKINKQLVRAHGSVYQIESSSWVSIRRTQRPDFDIFESAHCWLMLVLMYSALAAALGATAQVQGSEDYVCLYKDRSQLSPCYDQSL